MKATYDDLLARVEGLSAQLDRPPVVLIAGHGGAGKSTLATRLAKDLGMAPEQVVGTDELYAATAGPDSSMWELHDWPRLFALLRHVRELPTPKRLRFDYRWWTGSQGVVDEPMPPVVIVEGIRVIRPETRPFADLLVWIDLDAAQAATRAKQRNVLQGDPQEELDLWDTKWLPEGIEYETTVRPADLADLVIPAAGMDASLG